MFTNRDLRNLILPLFVEEFLLMFVGIADTFVVSFSSEADVSGVSLVTSFNTVLIFLFTALFSGGAALCRSVGRTNVTMQISIAANGINVIGNCAGVFLLRMGAAGVAWPSLLSRILFAALVTAYCFRKDCPVRYRAGDIFAWDGRLLKKVMGIALPNGVENGVHQLVKVALSSMVALFGTYQIAANGVAYPFAGPLGKGLRAAGDVRFTMLVSIALTIGARLFFSALFGRQLGLGVIGVAIGMSIDLVFRGAIFLWRLKSQKWTRFRLI